MQMPKDNALIKSILLLVYVFALAEGIVRGVTYFKPIFSIETVIYAEKLTIPSKIPGLKFEHRKNTEANVMGVNLALNSLGHRSPEYHFTARENTKPTIAFIGSSLTLGWGVSQKDTFAAQATQKMSDRGIIDSELIHVNAGVAGYTVADSINLFLAQKEILKPKIVVLQVFPGDIVPGSMLEEKSFLDYSHFIMLVRTKLVSFLTDSDEGLHEHYQNLFDKERPETSAMLEKIRQLAIYCESQGIKLVILELPDLFDLSQKGDELHERFKSVFAEFSNFTVDTFPALRDRFSKNPRHAWVSFDDRHPNSIAHSLIANAFVDAIENMKGVNKTGITDPQN
jgi:lysophospholipase L1-like esterase